MRGVGGTQFTQGLQDYRFSVGAPNVWRPDLSYFKVTMSLYNGVAGTTIPLTPAALTAFADNAAGNLYDICSFKGGEQKISQMDSFCAQASAIKNRLGKSLPWLKSMGTGAAVNEASFMKRMLAVSQYPGGSTVASPTSPPPQPHRPP